MTLRFSVILTAIAGILLSTPALLPTRAQDEPASEWISLFDGRTLDGWQVIGTAPWRVEDGVIVGGQDGDPSRSGLLASKATFQDFELELDFMIDEHGKYNSGVYLRNSPGTARRSGYQVNIGRGAAEEYCGLYLQEWLSKGDEKDEIRNKLAWNHYRILADGAHIEVDLNDVKIVDYTDPDPDPRLLQPGVIALQTYGAEGHAGWVKFKDIRIRNLRRDSSHVPSPATLDTGE